MYLERPSTHTPTVVKSRFWIKPPILVPSIAYYEAVDKLLSCSVPPFLLELLEGSKERILCSVGQLHHPAQSRLLLHEYENAWGKNIVSLPVTISEFN